MYITMTVYLSRLEGVLRDGTGNTGIDVIFGSFLKSIADAFQSAAGAMIIILIIVICVTIGALWFAKQTGVIK